MSSGQKAAGQRLESRSSKGRKAIIAVWPNFAILAIFKAYLVGGKILNQNFAKTYYIGQSKWPNVKS